MLHIEEAYRLFNGISKSIIKDDTLKINGVVISNYIDKSFGRMYLRTSVDIVSNFTLYHDKTYVSYRINNWDKGQGLIDNCKSVFNEQKRDVNQLKKQIKKLFPNLSVSIILSGHSFVKFDNLVYDDDLMLTGKPVLELIEPMDDETQWTLKHAREYHEYHEEGYLKRKKD